MTDVVVACGLRAEAKIAAGPNIAVIVGGGDQRSLKVALARAAADARALISFGVAGGLDPVLAPGSILVAEEVVAPDGRRFATDARWSASLAGTLGTAPVVFAGADAPVAGITEKTALRHAIHAAVVDMESHIAAEVAAALGKPFAAVRVVTDSAERPLPHAATVGMRPDGRVDLAAILRSLARNPAQLPGLIRTGLDARAAFVALLRCRQLLGPQFAFLDLG